MKNNFHILRQNYKLNIQDSYVFFDTESDTEIINNVEILKFKLACAIFWNKKEHTIKREVYFNPKGFWYDVENFFSLERTHILMYAHNTQFDFKMLNGFTELFNNNWKLKNFYVRNMVFILIFTKYDKVLKKHLYLHIYDTTNYFKQELKELGISINLLKFDIDFNQCTLEQLIRYCKRDTQIIFILIKRLVYFLEKNNLSKVKGTSGSLSFNIFRHRFYTDKKENERIYIHDWKKAINLERESYKGGISDCFKIGKYNNIYKLDINSMYPYIMRNALIPTKLIFYSHDSNYNQEQLFKIYNYAKSKGYSIIAKVKVRLPKDKAYILYKHDTKSMFIYGTFKTTLCYPELEYIENNGKLLYIYEINIYRNRNIFKDFVDYFYNLRLDYKKKNNKVYEQFCKMILNTLYGKFGQRNIIYERIDIKSNYFQSNKWILAMLMKDKLNIIKNNPICYIGTIINDCEIYIINHKLYRLKQTTDNSKDSFVAISSYITSYARMLLIKYLNIAKRINVCYTDTDSLFCNQQGYNNLLNNNCISKTKLGKLKNEGFGIASFYNPKFYDFNKIRKCKGIRKHSILISENKDKAIYEIKDWKKLKSDLKEGNLNKQYIITTKKIINKHYDKGKVDLNGIVKPYCISEIT